jgi:DNA-binding transcriptional LysR family regulator
MDIAAARTFLEIVKTGSFVRAAHSLHLTQTAVSARVRVLEERLGQPLFVRNKGGVKLTPAGQRFHRHAASLVQVWESAQRSVALPPGRDQVVTVGAELSLWSPLLRHWLLWMRRECPQIAVSAAIDAAERLIAHVQDGSLDVAIVYGTPRRPGLITELLFEEKLVQVRTTPLDQPLGPADRIDVHWGEEFAASFSAAFPAEPKPVISIGYGPLALEYILAVGGSGYFREGFVRPYLDEGRLARIADSPEFAYSASVVHSTTADEDMMARIRAGLRAAAALST